MVIGNIPLFLEQNELEAQDIVTYSFGDVDALYLRGQWTVHRNTRTISVLWKGCPHLGAPGAKGLPIAPQRKAPVGAHVETPSLRHREWGPR